MQILQVGIPPLVKFPTLLDWLKGRRECTCRDNTSETIPNIFNEIMFGWIGPLLHAENNQTLHVLVKDVGSMEMGLSFIKRKSGQTAPAKSLIMRFTASFGYCAAVIEPPLKMCCWMRYPIELPAHSNSGRSRLWMPDVRR